MIVDVRETHSKLLAIARGPHLEISTKLTTFRKAVESWEEKTEVYQRDVLRAHMSKILAEHRRDTAEVAYKLAKENCASLGGSENPAEIALKL